MKVLQVAALVAVLSSVAGHVSAQSAYYGVGFGKYELTTDFDSIYDGLEGTTDIKGIEGVWGFEQTPYIAWEARLGMGLGSDNMVLHADGKSEETDLEYKVSSYFSGYFRPQYKGSNVQVYGLLGYSSVGGEVSFDGESEDSSDDGFSYGIGAGFIFSGVNSLNIEWKNLAKIDGGEIKGVSFNFQRRY